MRRLISCLGIALLLSGAVVAADSPIDKGSVILGGSIYFLSQSGELYESGDEKDTPTTIGILPYMGYFVAPGIMIGGEVQFISMSIGDASMTSMGFGPVVGYYFNLDASREEIKGSVYPYIEGFFLYDKYTVDDGTDDNSQDGMSFGGTGGIVYMLSDAVSFDIGLLFMSESREWDFEGAESESGTTIMFSVGITAFVW